MACTSCAISEHTCTGMMGRACDRCRHQRLKCNFARGARGGSQRTDGNVGGSNTGGEKRKAGPSGSTTKKKSEGSQPPKRPRRDTTTTIDPKMLEELSEGSELDRVFKLVGDYIVAYDALADWYQKEKVRRAGRG